MNGGSEFDRALEEIAAGRIVVLTGDRLRGGDIELAREDARRWEEVIGHVPRFRMGYLRSWASLAKWDGDADQAIAYLQQALALAENIGLPGEQGQILARLGELHLSNGDEEQTKRALLQATEIVQTLAANIGNEGLRAEFLKANQIILTTDRSDFGR